MLILSVNPLHEDEATRARTWEARTRHRRCRTRVRRGGTRRRAGDAAARASSHVRPCRATWFSPTCADASRYGFDARRRESIRADSGLNRPESAGIGRNSRFRPKFKKKKKKKPRTHRNRPKLVFDCLIDCLLFSFNFELVSCILICKHHAMF